MKSAILLCALGSLLAAGCAIAQPVYRNVDANGKVSFSDQAPTAGAIGASTARATTSSGTANSASASLPYELRQTASRYPITLYTGTDCTPCSAGRSLLIKRGIPFAERSVTTFEDSEALQRLSGQKSLPLLSIGTQQLKGFSDPQWSQYLDAAGYPKDNLLPATYRNTPAEPLVAQQTAPAATESSNAAAAPATTGAPSVAPRNPGNPAGIRF